MPKFMELFGYYIYFWSNEGNPVEPIHVHISQNPHKNATKVWILSDGTTELCNNNDQIPSKTLKRILKSISIFSDDIIELWESNFQEITFYDSKNMDIER